MDIRISIPRFALLIAFLGSMVFATAPAKPQPFEKRLKAGLQKNLGDAETMNLLDEAEQLLLKSPKNEEYLEAVGLLHYRLKHWENAKLHLGRLKKASRSALDALGACHYELGEYLRAAAALSKGSEPSRSKVVWEMYNFSLQKGGRTTDAIIQWERFRQRNVMPPEALDFLANNYRRQKGLNSQKLLLVLEDLIKLKAGTASEPELLLEAVRLYPVSHTKAVEMREHYLQLQPDDPAVWRELAACYDARKDSVKAAEAYRKASSRFSSDGSFLMSAASAVAKVDPLSAIGLFTQAGALLPTDPKPYLELGALFEKMQKPDMALESYSEALRRAPRLQGAKDRLALLAASSRNSGDWLPALMDAEKRNPKDHAVQFNIARILSERGDSTKAYPYLAKALNLAPEKNEYRKLLPKVVITDVQILKHFGIFETLFKEGNPSPELLSVLCRGYAAQKNTAKTVEMVRELLKKDAGRVAGIRGAAFAAKAVKDEPLALKLAESYLATHPRDVEMRRLHVTLVLNQNLPASKQREAIQALMIVDPSEDEWLFRLAELDLLAGDTAGAFTHSQSWVRSHPEDTRGHVMIRMLSRGRKGKEAVYLASLNRLSRLDTAHRADFEQEIAAQYLATNETGKAVEMLGRLASVLTNDAAYWNRYGNAMRKLGRGASSNALEKAFRLQPGNTGYALDFFQSLSDDSVLTANLPALRSARQSPAGSASIVLRAKYARACYFTGQFPAAADEWESIAQKDSLLAVEDSTAPLALIRAGRTVRALAWLEKRISLHPSDTRALVILADQYGRTGRTKERTRILERLVKADPAGGDYPLLLAQDKETAGDYPAALRLYSLWCKQHPQDVKAIKAYRASASAAKDSAALLESLRLLAKTPNADRAIRQEEAEIQFARGGDPSELESLIKEYPDYKKGRLLLIGVYHAKSDFKSLARLSPFLTQAAQEQPDLLKPLADLQADQGKWEAANKSYFSWLNASPRSPAEFSKVLRLAREHQSPFLVSILRMGSEKNPDDLDQMAQYAAALGKTPSALTVYEELFQKKKDDPLLFTSAAALAKSMDRKDLALKWSEARAKLRPEDPKAWQTLSELHEQSGDKKGLAADLTELQRLQGRNSELAVRLGKLQEDLGQGELALAAYRAALYLNPKDKTVREKVIVLLRKYAPKESAAEMLTEIQTLDAGAHEAQFELARLNLQKGDLDKAYAYLIMALEKSPRNPDYLALLPKVIQTPEQALKQMAALRDVERDPTFDRSDTSAAWLFLHLARAFVKKEQWANASERYAAVFRLQPKLLLGDREVLTACFKGKGYVLVADLAEHYLERHPDPDPELAQMQVTAFEKAGKPEGAQRKALRQLLSVDKENTDGLLRLAELDLRARDTASALANIRQCLTAHPDEIRAYQTMLPIVEGRAEQKDAYVAALEKLAVLDSANKAGYWEKLAGLYEVRGNFREAHPFLSFLVSKRPKDAALSYRLGQARFRLQIEDLGLSAFQKAWDLAPTNVEYARSCARTLRSPKDLVENLDLLKFLNKQGPTSEEILALARAHYYAGDFAASAGVWDKVVEKSSDKAKLYSESEEAAAAYWRTGQWGKALPFYEARSSHESKSLPLLDTLLILYDKLDQESKRVQTLAEIVKLDPEYRNYGLQLAESKQKSGGAIEALAQYVLWTAKNPKDGDALRAQLQLADSLRDSTALENALRLLVKLPKPKPEYIYQMAELEYLQSGDISLVEKAVKAYPSYTSGRLILAWEYHQRGQTARIVPFESDMLAASTLGMQGHEILAAVAPELVWHELLGDVSAFRGKKEKANAFYLAMVRSRKESLRMGDSVSTARFRSALDKAWHYAETSASPSLGELLSLGIEVFPKDDKLAKAFGKGMGQSQKSLAFYQQWMKSHPDDVGSIPQASELALRFGDFSQALVWCRKWVELAPAELDAWKGLFTAAEKTGDVPTQTSALEKLVELQPTDAASANALGLIVAKKGENERALELLVRAADLNAKEKSYAKDVITFLEALAESSLKTGDRAGAAEWYGMLLDRTPGHRKASLYYGLFLARNKDAGAAVPLLKVGLEPGTAPPEVLAEAWTELGKAQSDLGSHEAARQAFEKALTLNPNDSVAALGVLAALKSLGRKKDMPAVYAAMLRIDSGNVEALNGLSAVRLAEGVHEEAARLLHRLSMARPEDPSVFVNYGKTLRVLKRNDEAAAAYAKARALGDKRPEILENLVRLHKESGTLRDEVSLLKEWVQQNPDDTAAVSWSAVFAEERGDWREAGNMWDLARQASPTQIRFITGLARAYLHQGETESVTELLEPLKTKLSAEGWEALGNAYAAIPENEKAAEAFHKARTLKISGGAVAGEAMLFIVRKRFKEAQKIFDEFGSLSGDLTLEKARGRMFLLQRSYDKALAAAKELARLASRDPEVETLMGEVLFARRDFNGSSSAFEAALKSDTSSFRALYFSGLARLELGKTAEARTAFFALGEKSDRRARALGLQGLGALALKTGKDSDAKEYWIQAASLQPSIQGFADLAALCIRLKQADEAEAYAARALEMDETFPDALAALSDAMLLRKAVQDAREYLQEALKQNPESCELQWALSRTQMEMNDYKSMAVSGEKSRKLCPDEALSWFYSGMAASKSGNKPEVSQYFSRYRILGGDPAKIPSSL